MRQIEAKNRSRGRAMKVIVVRQPWAWLIVQGHNDIENRTWATRYRGQLLIQASANLPPKRKLEEIRLFARERGVALPQEFQTGGIVGIVRLENCVTRSNSRWFEGPVGWVLSNPKKLPFIPLEGQLGLFDPPRSVLAHLRYWTRSALSGGPGRAHPGTPAHGRWTAVLEPGHTIAAILFQPTGV
jgi:hypothetical protein